jgi:hypothetical protein
MHTSIRTGRIALLVGLLACVAQAARAQDELPSLTPQLDPVWQRLAANNAKFLSRDQQALLDDMAFAAAVAAGCPGFKVDREKMKQGFLGFRSDDYMKQSPEEKRRREYHLMMNFGATVTLYAVEGQMHPKQSCKLAEERRGGGPGRFWLPAAAASTR